MAKKSECEYCYEYSGLFGQYPGRMCCFYKALKLGKVGYEECNAGKCKYGKEVKNAAV